MKEFFSNDGLFARTCNMLWDLIMVSILWFLCSIPLITLGAASTAAYYTCAKVLRRHNGHIIAEFFRSFRREFRQSTVFTFVCALILAVLVLDCVYFYTGSTFMLYLFYLMILMVIGCMSYFFPMLSRFSMTVFMLFRTSAVLMFRHLFKTILLLILLFSVALGIYLMPWGILVFPGLGFWLSTWLLEPVLRSCAPDPDPEESEKWYYS